MKIVNPSATVIEKELAGLSVCQRIDKLAGVCYQRNPKPTEEDAQAFCRSLIERGHLPALEFAVVHLTAPVNHINSRYIQATGNVFSGSIRASSLRSLRDRSANQVDERRWNTSTEPTMFPSTSRNALPLTVIGTLWPAL